MVLTHDGLSHTCDYLFYKAALSLYFGIELLQVLLFHNQSRLYFTENDNFRRGNAHWLPPTIVSPRGEVGMPLSGYKSTKVIVTLGASLGETAG